MIKEKRKREERERKAVDVVRKEGGRKRPKKKKGRKERSEPLSMLHPRYNHLSKKKNTLGNHTLYYLTVCYIYFIASSLQ